MVSGELDGGGIMSVELLKQHLGEELVQQLQKQIQDIENSIPTTKNHYGRYMAILSSYGEQKKVMAAILVTLGANKQGVMDALRLV